MAPSPDHVPSAMDAGFSADTGFAAQLRGRRLALGLTQEELAARSSVGVRTIRELERGRATRPQRSTVGLLAAALDLAGAARTEFVSASREHRFVEGNG